ncbi:uncharacterized protein LOC133840129 [Drosophila sulfurigaster albostrigata]|uniref:uncharacterized protein LOC133840129 n=1 Tax=Drosophila sulfurigaster albostrigata TaxID=89887 RepID=UPI002D218274|nr:uncharacterized protein LOC133840129 [Drosophila sulfurigaster albostrigata]
MSNINSTASSIRPLPAGLQQVAIEELNEVPSRVSEDIAVVRDWLQKQPHLCSCLTDQFLLAFLRGSKFSLEKAKHKIDRYYTLQAAIPEVFNEHRLADDPQVLEIIRMGVILRIPLDEGDTGPAVTIIRAGSYDTAKYKFQDIIRVGSMFGEIMMLEDDNANVSGYIEIMDMTGVSAANLFALQPQLLSKFSAYADEAMPTRQKGIHFINVPPSFESGFNSLRSFFPDKIKNRVSVSSDPEAIFERVRREYLPQEYGGTKGTMQDILDQMEAKMLSYRDYFEQSRHFGANEKLREDVSQNEKYPSYFGLDGSFRKLDIDSLIDSKQRQLVLYRPPDLVNMPDIRPLRPELQKIAIEQLFEKPERIDDDIAALRLWIKQQPHLKARTDDQFLVNFLRGCKYSLQKTKSKMDRFYTLRTKYPEYFIGHNVDVDKLLKLFRTGTVVFLPRPLHDNGPRIAIIRMAAYNPDQYNFVDINLAGGLMHQIVLNEDDDAIVHGTINILDLANVKMGHFVQMTPSFAKKMTVFQEEALPMRTKGTHFINTPGNFDKVFNMFKPMMSKKQQDRLYVHGTNIEKLYEQIPQKYLPVEYGGENGSIEELVKEWEERILAYRNYWVEEQNYGTDERLRPGKPVDFESLFGMEGSFRQLNVD